MVIEVALGIVLGWLIITNMPRIIGGAIFVIFAIGASIPCLLAFGLSAWAVMSLPDISEQWVWAIVAGVLVCLAIFAARIALNLRRASSWEWFAGHYLALGTVLLLGIPLLPAFRTKTIQQRRRELGYDT